MYNIPLEDFKIAIPLHLLLFWLNNVAVQGWTRVTYTISPKTQAPRNQPIKGKKTKK